MRGPLTKLAEVAGSIYDPSTEMFHPHPIHKHPRGQRILRTRDSFREFQPAASLSEKPPLLRREDCQKTPGSNIPLIVAISANQNMLVRDLGLIADCL